MKENLEICEIDVLATNDCNTLKVLRGKEQLQKILNPGTINVGVLIQRKGESPSKEQHGYFGFLCGWLSKNAEPFFGCSPAHIRKWAKCEFLTQAISYELFGKVYEYNYTPSLSELNKKQFSEFMEAFVAKITEEVGELPPPNNNARWFHIDDGQGSGLDIDTKYEPKIQEERPDQKQP